MAVDLAQQRQQAHAYLDQLPPAQLSAVRSLREAMVDPVAQAIAHAPVDDEPLSEEDRKALAEAQHWSRQNKPIPVETVLADLGLTMRDWEQMGKMPTEGRG
ncbi:MAG: hypothetical protein JO145_01105 [Acidobacteriaceae bacterium]|nr:hypothetical protein [Acidobacteriaceae bacterium]